MKRLIVLAIVAVIGFGVWSYGPSRVYHNAAELFGKGAAKAEESVTKDNLDDLFRKGSDKVKQGGDVPYLDAAKGVIKDLKIDNTPEKVEKYARDKFGAFAAAVDSSGWKESIDGKAGDSLDKCDTKEAAFIEYGKNVKVNDDCSVMSGTWTDPYGWKGNFLTSGDKNKFDVDNIVPLKNMWYNGAAGWDDQKRTDAMNDELNMIVASKTAIGSKGSLTIDKYVPAKNSPRFCDYVTRYVAVKGKYDIPVTTSEKKAIDKHMKTCEG